ncbi:MAG TPA: 4-alpha-glucanotransferase, partial [Vicinamibacterales bacterium]|nr:4-alpha-glucanotransferase [Vicinamibacterales bacterium]
MRHAGVSLPLFSAASSQSWGIGDLRDLAPLSAWLASAGFSRLMILPIGVVAPGDTSPYSAQSTMAIDPMYVAIDAVADFAQAGGVGALTDGSRQNLVDACAAPRVRYELVRQVKDEALSLAFGRFFRDEWEQLSTRAAELAGYVSRERWWLDDWALYAAIAQRVGSPDWRDWPPPLRDRMPGALDEARRQLARDVLRHQYVQWIAESQWQAARASARGAGVTVIGDMPFMMAAGSPDVWTHAAEVNFDVSLGVPPDAFSALGQDWGLPAYRWDRIAETGYAWLRHRAARMAALFDGFRVDHLVGLYRTYQRPPNGDPFFSPGDEAAQLAQGEAILRILIDTGATIIAEDLGVVPPFVRQSLARLDVPGCKVMRWEREWNAPGQPLVDPASYPARSAAMTGTHDTETLAEWAAGEGGLTWSGGVRDALLASAYGAGSDELFMPIQDVFGWTDRINIPATIGPHNWTWRLPWRVDEMPSVAEARERAEFCRRLG